MSSTSVITPATPASSTTAPNPAVTEPQSAALDRRAPGAPRVLVVARHRTLRQALCRSLVELGFDTVTEAPPGREALVAAIRCVPHVVLVDVATDATGGLETCRQFTRAALRSKVVALTPRLGVEPHAARAAGVAGVVCADTAVEELADFLALVGDEVAARRAHAADRRSARAGTDVLSRREREVLSLAASGLTDRQLAHSLYVSVKTVKNHLHHIYGKLGARGRTEAVVIASRQGLITL